MAKKAVLAGASGLIGSALLDILLQQQDYSEVLVLVRKELPRTDKKLRQLVIDFDKLNDYAAEITGHVIFCCLGTTKKQTPDQNTYWKIDHDYAVQLAELGVKNGMPQFHLVSTMGANAEASGFYLKLKGQTEADVIKAGPPDLHIYRPALLIGERKEHRAGEKAFTFIMKLVEPLLFGSLKKYRSIPGKTVASAMYKQSLQNNKGVQIHLSDKIKELS